MRLFFVLVCCLAIPLVARAANQGKNGNQKQTTQGHQQQTATQSNHSGASTSSQGRLNSSSQLRGQGQHRTFNTQNSNTRVVRSNTRGTVNHSSATTASRLRSNNSSQSNGQGQRHALNGQNKNLPAVQSSTNGKVASQHFALSNSRNPNIASAKFSQNYRIQGSQNWQGQQYGAFQNYRGQWHDQGYWNSNYDRIGLFGGGWYFWNSGYWYPAWGYDSAYAYYPYNGPIYGYNNLPPDQVIANVQSTLHAQGYYHGAVDGTLGPVTRAALGNYQRDHNLYTTSAIDEPTLESLGLS